MGTRLCFSLPIVQKMIRHFQWFYSHRLKIKHVFEPLTENVLINSSILLRIARGGVIETNMIEREGFWWRKLRNEVVGIFPFIKTFSGMRPPVRWKSWWIPRNEWWRQGNKNKTQPAELISNISVVRVSQRNMVIVTNVYELSLSLYG